MGEDTAILGAEEMAREIEPHPATKGPVVFQNPAVLRQAAAMLRALSAVSDQQARVEEITKERDTAREAWATEARQHGEIIQANAILHEELDRARNERDEANRTIARVWQALGIDTYEGAKGKYISELVAEIRVERSSLEERVKELEGRLEPFVRYADALDLDGVEGEIGEVYRGGLRVSISYAALRAARALLSRESKTGESADPHAAWEDHYADAKLPTLIGDLHDVDDDLPAEREVCEVLGFDPTNHHNVLKCPYCNPNGWVLAPPAESKTGERGRLNVTGIRLRTEDSSSSAGQHIIVLAEVNGTEVEVIRSWGALTTISIDHTCTEHGIRLAWNEAAPPAEREGTGAPSGMGGERE